MAYESVKNQIDAYIKANGVNLITGPVLNAVLTTMLDELGEGYAFQGVLNTTDTPSPAADIPQAWLASAGTYLGGSITVDEGELALIIHAADGWSKETVYRDVQLSDEAIVAALGYTPADDADLAEKQDTIADLSAIRSGAALGETSVQPVDIENMVEAEPIGSIIPPVNPSEFATKEEVSQLGQKVGKIIIADPLTTDGGYLYKTSGIVAYDPVVYYAFAFSDFVPLKFFDKFSLTGILARTDLAYACIYNSDKAFIASYVYSSETNVVFDVRSLLEEYPAAFYIRFCGASGRGNTRTKVNGVLASFEYITKIVSEEGTISKLVDNTFSYQTFENIITQNIVPVAATKGYQTATGSISGDGTDSNWFHTEFLPVKLGDTIICAGLTGQGSAVMTVGFFDASKACITADSYKATILKTSPVSFTITNPNIAFVRFSGDYSNWFGTDVQKGVISMPLQIAISKKLDLEIEKTDSAIGAINAEIEDINSRIPASGRGMISDIEHIVCYGQSLSQGDWETHIVTYAQKYNSLMFTGTIRVWEYRDQAHKYDALIPAVEDVFTYQSGETPVGATSRGETPCCGTAEKAMELIIADGFDIEDYQYQLLVSAPGMGGVSISALSKGGSYYTRLLADVQAGKNLANAAGKSFVCRGVSWLQGESDSGQTFSYYYNAMAKLFDDLDADIRAITGQSEKVQFFLYQMRCYDWYYTGFHWPNVPLAQLAICKDRKDCHMVGPFYQMPLMGDYTHFTAESSKWYGGYIGKVWKKVLIDGEDWKPISLKNYQVIGNTILLQFNVPNPPLTFDTINAVDRGVSKGFQIRNADDFAQNSYLDIITNVEIIRPNTVRITCSQSPSGKRLTYAINGTATPESRSDMGSGNLRDSCTDVFNFPIEENGQDVEHKMFNWCPLFDQVLE